MPKLVLASNSPRRIEILKMLGINFKVVSHKFKEPKLQNHPQPEKFVEQIAIKKAMSISYKLKNNIIISADTIVVLNNEIIGKPKDENEARQILVKLANTKHKVYTGVCIYYPKKNLLLSGVEKTVVYTNNLTRKQINYLAKKHLDKAGAYAVQHKNDRFVKKIVGDYYNVVGFPVKLFLELYKKLWSKLLSYKIEEIKK